MTTRETKTHPAGTEPAARSGARSWASPPIDLFESPAEVLLAADLPGVRPEGLKVEVHRGTLRIEAHRSLGEHARALDLDYRRSFELGVDLDPEGVSAALAHGVLTVRIPRRAAPQPRQVPISAA